MSARRIKVLIADDDRVFVELNANRLRSRGMQVAVAYDAPTALMTAVKQAPSVILLDVRLPGGNGLDLLKRLKASYRTEPIAVVIVTATQDEQAEKLALEAGAAGFIRKPVDGDRLYEEIVRIAGTAS